MNIIIFDTETISLDKPYCYNIGYVIVNVETEEILLKRDFVIEQIWHNIPLFSSAYYATKRSEYVKGLKGRSIIMRKFGIVTQYMYRDIQTYEVEFGYAYNSKFDEKVFDFNCDFFKCSNPLDLIPILDIRNFFIQKIVKDNDYFDFCDKNQFYTDAGNYSSTAEIAYRYITKNLDFIEDHTALSDSLIETEILLWAFKNDINIFEEKKVPRFLTSNKIKQMVIKSEDTELTFDYKKYIIRKNNDGTTLKLIL